MAAFVDHPAVLFAVLFALLIVAVAFGVFVLGGALLHCAKTNAMISTPFRGRPLRCWRY